MKVKWRCDLKKKNLYYVKITIIMYLTVGAAVVQLTLSGETYL